MKAACFVVTSPRNSPDAENPADGQSPPADVQHSATAAVTPTATVPSTTLPEASIPDADDEDGSSPVSHRKQKLAQWIVTGRLDHCIGSLRRLTGTLIPILGYHRIWPLDKELSFPFDQELVSATPEEFAWQMQYVREQFHPITFADLLRALDGTARLPKRPLIVTFDDGYEDNATIATPILHRLGMPATFFLATGYINQPQTFWYDRLAQLLNTTFASQLQLLSLPDPFPIPAQAKGRRWMLRRLLSHLKKLPNADRLAELEQCERQLADRAENIGPIQSRAMSWSQAREMVHQGMELASHAVSHPVLANCDDKTLRYELQQSRHEIQQQTGQPADVISYPVGGPSAFSPRVVNLAQEAGYRLGVSYIHGMNRWNRFDRFALRRIHVERYHNRDYFRAMLQLPELFL